MEGEQELGTCRLLFDEAGQHGESRPAGELPVGVAVQLARPDTEDARGRPELLGPQLSERPGQAPRVDASPWVKHSSRTMLPCSTKDPITSPEPKCCTSRRDGGRPRSVLVGAGSGPWRYQPRVLGTRRPRLCC